MVALGNRKTIIVMAAAILLLFSLFVVENILTYSRVVEYKNNVLLQYNTTEGDRNSSARDHISAADPYTFSEKIRSNKKKQYLIYWYSILPNVRLKLSKDIQVNFDQCRYRNCLLTFNKNQSNISDAVLFDGRSVPATLEFTRPMGQVWIFTADESVQSFEDTGGHWLKPQWRSAFNWTMTYDKSNSDIFMPYGELLPQTKPVTRNFTAIALLKSQGALMINSHCPSRSRREQYVDKLKQYIQIEVLGHCGKPWNCGTHYVHDDCFNIINTTYKFFLPFENAFCHQYFTEKIYDNFNFDTVHIVRGGSYREAQNVFPQGTVISTDDFSSIEELGKYLQKVSGSFEEYAKLLEAKSKYYSPGFLPIYQRAMCDVCERLNNMEKYRKVIPDIQTWAYDTNPCQQPKDLN